MRNGNLKGHRRKGPRKVGSTGEGLHPIWEHAPHVVHQGIKRRPDAARPPLAPLTDRHRAVLALLVGDETRPIDIARTLGITHSAVISALEVLQRRGLAQHLPGARRGWRRTDGA